MKTLFSDGAIDDRTNIFTMALSYLCNLPQGSEIEKKLNDKVMTLLYNTLAHPPATYLGTNPGAALSTPPAAASKPGSWGTGSANGTTVSTQNGEAATTLSAEQLAATQTRWPYAFRSADGEGNNPLMPNMGRAGLPYARSVQNRHPFAPNALPDPGAVFDSLLCARNVRVSRCMWCVTC